MKSQVFKICLLFAIILGLYLSGIAYAHAEEMESGQTILNLVNMSEKTFNNLNDPVEISISTEFSNVEDIYAFINGLPVSKTYMELTSSRTLVIGSVLVEGRNELFIVGQDEYGNVFEREFILWAGDNILNGLVLKEENQPVQGARVRILLDDDKDIMTNLYTDTNGEFTAVNLPNRTIFIEVYASDNLYAREVIMGGDDSIILKLKGFDTPCHIDNNDFSEGTAGWNIGTAPVEIIPHIEK